MAAEKSDEIWRIEHIRNFDEQNLDELIVAFIGKVLTGKTEKENFDESLAVGQNLSDFSTVKVLRYTVVLELVIGSILIF